MTTSLTVLVPLAQKINPADVKPGWLAFGIFLAMFAAVILLWLSMRKQLKKVNFEEKDPGKKKPGQTPENGSSSPA